MSTDNVIRLGIAGLGTIGMKVARAVDNGDIPGIRLTAVSARAGHPAHRGVGARP